MSTYARGAVLVRFASSLVNGGEIWYGGSSITQPWTLHAICIAAGGSKLARRRRPSFRSNCALSGRFGRQRRDAEI